MVLQYFTNMFARRRFTIILQWGRKARIHNLFTKRGFHNNFYNIHTDALFPVLIHLIYNIHTGELGSGLTFISFATILFLLP